VRALVGLLGLAFGMLLAVIVLVFNPLAGSGTLRPLPADVAPIKVYAWEYRGMAIDNASLLGLGQTVRGVALLDPALRGVRIGIVVLPAGEGTSAALAVKVSTTAEENSLWRAQLGTNDYWNIFWSGEGSVFASGYSNYWGMLRDSFLAAVGGSDDASAATGRLVSAPSPSGSPVGIAGASGRYAGFLGEIREFRYPAAAGARKAEGGWGIATQVTPPPVTTR
jgi:hypothetical protein